MFRIHLQKNTKLGKRRSGFTLLEMIVSLGVFTMVAVIAVGSLVRITGLNRQAQSLQSAMNNINFILESISREMRFGSKYNCLNANSYNGDQLVANDCNSGLGNSSKGILFNSTKAIYDPMTGQLSCHLIIAYWFVPSGAYWDIRKSQQTSCKEKLDSATAVSMVDSGNIKILKVDFKIFSGNEGYSWATIDLGGYSGTKANERSNFDIRTGISQRILDIASAP